MTIEQLDSAPLMEALAKAKSLLREQPDNRSEVTHTGDAILMAALLVCSTIADAASKISKTMRELAAERRRDDDRRHLELMRKAERNR